MNSVDCVRQRQRVTCVICAARICAYDRTRTYAVSYSLNPKKYSMILNIESPYWMHRLICNQKNVNFSPLTTPHNKHSIERQPSSPHGMGSGSGPLFVEMWRCRCYARAATVTHNGCHRRRRLLFMIIIEMIFSDQNWHAIRKVATASI